MYHNFVRPARGAGGGDGVIRIDGGVSISEHEIRFTASRSSGPGGQRVNKASTRLTLRFDLRGSRSLSEAQKERIAARLPGRINRDGVLALHSQRHRGQAANRTDLTERFAALLREALRRRAVRRRTRPPRSARERRLREKKSRGRLKASRSAWIEGED
ncbi:MAG: alternative ribosome rescue aminoacyl-tRNA hydrolase ArfB [Acidobacteriota bacterium]